jgi:uncharacterized integral membrane protein
MNTRRSTHAQPETVASPGTVDKVAATPASPDRSNDGARRSRPNPGVAAGVVFLVLGGILVFMVVAQNSERVTFEFAWWDVRVPLAVVVLAAVLLTVVVDQVVGLAWRRRRRQYRTLLAGSRGT